MMYHSIRYADNDGPEQVASLPSSGSRCPAALKA